MAAFKKEEIEPGILDEVAKALKIPLEAIRNFDENAAVNIVSNTFTDFKDNSSAINHNCVLNFNPIDKIMELFERLLSSEKEKVELMKEILDRMKKLYFIQFASNTTKMPLLSIKMIIKQNNSCIKCSCL